MNASVSQPEAPLWFIIVTFAVASAVGALIAYLGITGVIGAGIP